MKKGIRKILVFVSVLTIGCTFALTPSASAITYTTYQCKNCKYSTRHSNTLIAMANAQSHANSKRHSLYSSGGISTWC